MANARFAAPYIIHKEGGLSRATTDTASKNPAPCSYKGQTGWHTNKGITWSTFKRMAPVVGYSATCDLFFSMPDDVWFGIFKKGYWDAIGGDQIKSDVIATYATSWVWGGGGRPELSEFLNNNGYKTTTKKDSIVQALNDWIAKDEQQLFDKMLDHRAEYFRSLGQPANLKGWLNRLDAYRSRLSPYIGKYKTNIAIIIAVLALFFLAVGVIWPYRKEIVQKVKQWFTRK